MRIATRLLLATAFVAASVAAFGGCPGGKGLGGKLPGGGGLPSVPGGVPATSLDPNACGGYASSDAGRKLKAFLVATQDVQTATVETLKVVKQSCIMLGTELGMADLGGEAEEVCAKVYGQVDKNLNGVAFKSKAGLKVQFKPAVCKLSVEATANAAASCEGKASADIKASCGGTCRGTCDGTCSAKGANGECAGECKGTCKGSCEGYADVDASAECRASAEIKASGELQCTEPELKLTADAKLVVDKAKAEQTIKAMMAALPQILSVKARLVPLKHAVETWAKSSAALAAEGQKIAQAFGDQAMCVSGQIAFAAKAAANVQANVSVSVSVSASASGSIGSN